MGETVIHTDSDGTGHVVLDDAPITDVERVLVVRQDQEHPNAVLGVTDVGAGEGVRIDVAGAEADSDVTVSWEGAPDAHVSEEADEAAAEEDAEESAPEQEAEAGDEEDSEPEVSTDLSRDQLNKLASEAGVDDPEALSNKQAVVDAIEAAASKED